jgi:hypothetical protein
MTALKFAAVYLSAGLIVLGALRVMHGPLEGDTNWEKFRWACFLVLVWPVFVIGWSQELR